MTDQFHCQPYFFLFSFMLHLTETIYDIGHNLWHLPLLTQPGPLRLAIHWASLSPTSFASRLAVTALLSGAPLAAPEMAEIRDSRHCAWVLTTQVLTRLRDWATRPLSFSSISCFPPTACVFTAGIKKYQTLLLLQGFGFLTQTG